MKSKRLFDSARRGFTLIELMVVVALVLILATLGGLKYMRYREFTAGVACNALLQEIQNARIALMLVNGKLDGSSTKPNLLKPYMSSTDIYRTNTGNNLGDSFYCPYLGNGGLKQIRVLAGNGTEGSGDISNLPTCENWWLYGDNGMNGYQLHLLGGYRKW